MDRRIIKTKNDLKTALIDLLKTVDIKKISVTDITQKANINRGTFYLHYADIYDMVNKMEHEVFEDLIDIVTRNVDHLEKEEYYYPIIEVATYAKANKDFFKAMTSVNGDLNFESKIKRELMKIFDLYSTETLRKIEDPVVRKSYESFMIHGGVGIFIEWIKDDCSKPAAEVIRGLVRVFFPAN